jgi:hypothetical protein
MVGAVAWGGGTGGFFFLQADVPSRIARRAMVVSVRR